MRLVGLTGGTGTGKSTVADRWASTHSLTVIDADALARAVVVPGAWGHRRLVAALGRDSGFFNADGTVDRAKLGTAAWHDAATRCAVNRATHTPIALALARALVTAWLSCALVVVLDVPLLFESGLWRVCGACVLVDAPAERQIARIMARDGLLAVDAAARVAAQAPASTKRGRCAVVIQNDGTVEELKTAAGAAASTVLRHVAWHALVTPPAIVVAVAVWRR